MKIVERVWREAPIIVQECQSRVISCQERLRAAEGMYSRGTGTLEDVESRKAYLAKAQARWDTLRRIIDEYNVTLEDSGKSQKDFDKRQRQLGQYILRYNVSYKARYPDLR